MTSATIGLLWALVAMFAWGIGDFLIHRDVRSLGIWQTLFYIGIVGVIGLLPLVWQDLQRIHDFHILIYPLIAGFITLVSSIFDFEAFKQGKLSIVEPIVSVEVPLAAIFAVVLWSEHLSLVGWLLIIAIFISITLVATEHHSHLQYHKRIFEKGVIYALITAVCMALTDLLMGVSGQETTPLFTVWSVWLFFTIACFIYLLSKGKMPQVLRDIKERPWTILIVGIVDTLAWVAFCFATVNIPIAIATAIGQAYIVITILLGLFINRERLQRHQLWGVASTVISVIILAFITG